MVDGLSYAAGLTPDLVRELASFSSFNLGTQYQTGALSSAGMDGEDGAWPVLYGTDALAGGNLRLGMDEDQLQDNERVHTTEEVALFLTR